MKKKTKLYLRLNLLSLFFVVVSFISVTLAWFVYSGLSTVSTEVNVKAWYIELTKDDEVVSNNIVISLDDIYPGMETIEEEIKIKNLGDSDAQVKYEIASARILGEEKDNYVTNETTSSSYIEDIVSHEYPFHINIDISKKFIVTGTDEATFKVSISWPLDSGDDALDSEWGTKAYKFKQEEQKKKDLDPNYQIRAAIKIDIKLSAEQYLEIPESSDKEYRLGNEILFDVVNNKKCSQETETCIRTNVIDVNNTLEDTTVTLLPKVAKTYPVGSFGEISAIYSNYVAKWAVKTKMLDISHILKPISKDIKTSTLVRPNISELVIGDLNSEDRINKVMTKAITGNGYFKYLNKFMYFYSSDCFWLNNAYNETTAFAVSPLDTESMKIYSELKTTKCKVVPVIIAEKTNLKASLNNENEVNN